MKNILVYGDSNSWGFVPGEYNPTLMIATRYSNEKRWPRILNKLLSSNFHVIEENLNGRNTSFDEIPATRPSRNGLATLPGILEMHHPLDLVILMLGTNDLRIDKGNTPSLKKTVFGMKSLIHCIKKSHCGKDGNAPKILVITPAILAENISSDMSDSFDNTSVEKSKQLAPHYELLAFEEKCDYLDANDYVQAGNTDGVHIEENDQPILAKAIAEKILTMIL